SWTNSTTYHALYNVLDLNVTASNIDVRVTGGQDAAGNVQAPATAAGLFSIDTQDPIVASITRNNPALNNLSTVGWTVTLSESVTGVNAGNFSLYNGGLGGTPNISSVTGGGTTWIVQATGYAGEGTLGLYVTSTAGVTDVSGNPLAGLPVTAP